MLAFLALLLSTMPPGPISGDFDHDGKADTARILRGTGGGYVLEISRGAAASTPIRIDLGQNPPDFMVPAKNGGSVATACGKGMGAKSDPCPRASIQVTRGDLLLGSAEASGSVLIWDGKTFQQEWISD